MILLPIIESAKNWPTYWFARLEVAVERGDHTAAAQAQQELARLGVRVNYGRPQQSPVPASQGASRG